MAGMSAASCRAHVCGPVGADATAAVGELLVAGFGLLPTFSAPQYSVVLGSYTAEQAELLIGVLGEIRPNPHHVRRQQ